MYEHLPLTISTQVCKIDLTNQACDCDCEYLFLTTTKLQFALLATSELIRDEAQICLDMALAKTQPGYLNSAGLNGDIGRVHPCYFLPVLYNAVASQNTQGYQLRGLAEEGIFSNDDLAKVLDFCAFAKQHHKSIGRNPKAEIHWPGFPHHTIDDCCETLSYDAGITVGCLKKLPAALELRLAELKEA